MLRRLKNLIPNKNKRFLKHLLRNLIDSFQYYVLDKQIINGIEKRPKRVIFICKGNVCRSPFAEKRLECLTSNLNIITDSCGLDVDQGNFPPDDSITAAKTFSCDLEGRRAKGIADCDILNADLIIPMEYGQYRKFIKLFPGKKKNIRLMRSFAPFPYSLLCNISDPFGWGLHEFEKSFQLIDDSLQALVKDL